MLSSIHLYKKDKKKKDKDNDNDKVKKDNYDKETDEIKLTKNNQITHKNQFMLPFPFLSIGIIGASGSGKSVFLLSLIPKISKQIKNIVIATTIHGNKTHQEIANYCDANNIKFHLIIDNPEQLTNLVSSFHNKPSLIIFDDYTDHKNKNKFEEAQIQIFNKFRNYNCNFIIIAQSPQRIPVPIRNNLNIRVCFRLPNKTSRNVFLSDVKDRIINNNDKVMFEMMFDKVFNENYVYIIVYDSNPISFGFGMRSALFKNEDLSIPSLKEIFKDMNIENSSNDADNKERMYESLYKKSLKLQRKAGNV